MTETTTPIARRRRRLLIPVAIAVVALALAAATATGGAPRTDDVGESVDSNTFGAAQHDLALGSADAPVVMVAYSEFQCPFCGRFARDTAPELIERYVEPGVLRIEWRDFPYLGAESYRAALAGRAAAAQGAFWGFHDRLFADQAPNPNSGQLTERYLIDVADGLGLDVERFESDLRDATGDEEIRADFEAGLASGVNSTPAFFVNGTPVFGAQPTEVFIETIEAAAEAASA